MRYKRLTKRKGFIIAWATSVICAVLLLLLYRTHRAYAASSFPRLANIHLSSGFLSPSMAQSLSRWDVVVLRFEIPPNSHEVFHTLKQLNPDMKVLMYIDSIMIASSEPDQEPGRTHFRETSSAWLLRSAEGSPMTYWPNNWIANPTDFTPLVDGKRWNTFLPEFSVHLMKSQGGWDGIFYDDAQPSISWLNEGDIDINNDGKKDVEGYIDREWVNGMQKLFQNTRTRLGPDDIIVTNSGSVYRKQTNGRMFENYFLDKGSWQAQIDEINDLIKTGGYVPRYVIVNAGTNNRGDWQNWKNFRYAYTSTLMTDAYFSYDFGDKSHNQLWWYDEYDVPLGEAANNAYAVRHGDGSPTGIWRRDFEKGIALVNTSAAARTIDLGGTFKKINGTQDKKVNNGQIVTQVTLNPYDGMVLQKNGQTVMQELKMTQGFVAGARVAFYDGTTGAWSGSRILHQPFISDGTFGLGNDLNGDGKDETVVYEKGALSLYRNGKRIWVMYPYDNKWRGPVSLASGDVNGDGTREIIIAAGPGGGPHVRIVGSNGRLLNAGFFAGDKRSRGGVFIAACDVNKDGVDEIVAGSGQSEASRVSVYSAQGLLLNFFALSSTISRNGVTVTADDIDNDGRPEIIAGNGNKVFVYSLNGTLIRQFAVNSSSSGLVKVLSANDSTRSWILTYPVRPFGR
ncbi:MAG: putative glycoside hydrolase [Patescibacteria group bacterium]